MGSCSFIDKIGIIGTLVYILSPFHHYRARSHGIHLIVQLSLATHLWGSAEKGIASLGIFVSELIICKMLKRVLTIGTVQQNADRPVSAQFASSSSAVVTSAVAGELSEYVSHVVAFTLMRSLTSRAGQSNDSVDICLTALRSVECWADIARSTLGAEASWGGGSKSSESEDDELHVGGLLFSGWTGSGG